ncbi:hypothetical protein HELRODRAFT_173759 [Helobdella robusta]|uniref:C2H2-type domain-containing protein n=1 Tax=Helobdella robusta TaxID=6412 RepID=T1F771_HELRO|nr:hypothetical protein HELRODRAFT_173759 [Helobdella robusta]ESO03460.1 hypothetical protein HELRODRAFT_173759 [Helobdella robusta]
MDMRGMKQEMDDDLHTCIICKEEFLEEEQYWKHMRHVHADINPIPSNSNNNNSSSNNNNNNTSVKTNLKDLPLYTCSVCQKLFTQETYLLKHIEHKTDTQHQETYKRILKSIQQGGGGGERRMSDGGGGGIMKGGLMLPSSSEGHSSKSMKEKDYFREDMFKFNQRDSCLKYMDAFPDVTQQQQQHHHQQQQHHHHHHHHHHQQHQHHQQQQQQMRFGMNSFSSSASSSAAGANDESKQNNGWSRDMYSDNFSSSTDMAGKHLPHLKSKYDQDMRSNNNNNSSSGGLQVNKSLSSSSSFSSSSSLLDKNEMDDMSNDDFNNNHNQQQQQQQPPFYQRPPKNNSSSNMIGHTNTNHSNLGQVYMSAANQQSDFVNQSPGQSNESCNNIIMNNNNNNSNSLKKILKR